MKKMGEGIFSKTNSIQELTGKAWKSGENSFLGVMIFTSFTSISLCEGEKKRPMNGDVCG